MKSKSLCRIFSFILITTLLLSFASCGGKKGGDPTESQSVSTESSAAPTENPTELPTEEEDVPPQKRVAFTFDDGPHPVYTKQIVDTALSYGGRVTFFVAGYMIERSQKQAEALVYAIESGCEVGLHSYTHQTNYDECDEETFKSELSRTLAAIRQHAPDFECAIMRPVGGRISQAFVKGCPYAVVKWSVDTRDWERYGAEDEQAREANVQAIVDEIIKSAKDGSIILMHDLYENTATAFARAAAILAEEGYEFVTVSELLGEDLEAGKVFSKGKPIAAVGNQK